MALTTPSPPIRYDLHSHVGGVRRDKAEASARISARSGSVVNAAGGAALLIVMIASTSLVCFAAEEPAGASTQPVNGHPAAKANPAAAPVDSANPPEKRWPPAHPTMVSPSAPLDRKSEVSVRLVHKWRDKNVLPTMAERGEVVFIFGATQDTVVGAPLRISDIALQPGEIVQNINLGDPTNWSCPPAISGTGAEEITHLMCKPADAGLETSLAIQTSRRSYAVNLISTRSNYMPKVRWSYPDDQAKQWAAYQQRVGSGEGSQHSLIPDDNSSCFRYDISGDNPSWRPIVAYSCAGKTYIQFPPAMAYGTAPVFERLH